MISFLPNFFIILLILSTSCQSTSDSQRNKEKGFPAVGNIHTYDERIHSLIADGTQIEVIAEGFSWSEGPLWLEDRQALIFSDVPENKIYQWTEKEGVAIYLEPSGFTDTLPSHNEKGSNGLALNPDGQLILAQHGNRQVALMDAALTDPTATFIPMAASWEGKRFNSPNDLTVHSNGDIYFTDPPYGLPGKDEDTEKEIPFNGVYLIRGEEVILLIDSLTRPNGIALSADQTRLFVANSDPERAFWAEYGLNEQGTITYGRVFFEATDRVDEAIGLPDGMKVHPSGNIFATGPGGLYVFAESGDLLAIVDPGAFASNCSFNRDFTYIYMTVDSRIMRVALQPLPEG